MIIRPDTFDLPIHNEIYKQWVYDAMILDENDRVLDIGANVWYYALKAAETAKCVFAFEPEKTNFRQLVLNTAWVENIVKIKAALAFQKWTWVLYVTDQKNNWLHTLIPTPDFKAQSVELHSIDEVVAQHKITKIKIDCEWWEFDILEGYEFPDHVTEIIWEGHVINRDYERAFKLMDFLSWQFDNWWHTMQIWMPIFNFNYKR